VSRESLDRGAAGARLATTSWASRGNQQFSRNGDQLPERLREIRTRFCGAPARLALRIGIRSRRSRTANRTAKPLAHGPGRQIRGGLGSDDGSGALTPEASPGLTTPQPPWPLPQCLLIVNEQGDRLDGAVEVDACLWPRQRESVNLYTRSPVPSFRIIPRATVRANYS